MNNIYFTQAWDTDKSLGKYYNEFMAMISDGSYGCLMDYDTMFLTNDYGYFLFEYVDKFPYAVLTFRSNRLHFQNTVQQIGCVDKENHDINFHRKIANERRLELYKVTDISDSRPPNLMAGMMMLIPKKIWQDVGGFDENGILGVDNFFHQKLQKFGKKVLVMEGIYVYHWYRADGNGSKHLQ